MKVKKFLINGLVEIQPNLYYDDRGYFFESYNEYNLGNIIFEVDPNHIPFIQDNESCSTKGVLRGMHMQFGEFSQAKLVRVISGMVLDVVVDLRKDSPTYGKHESVLLSGAAHNMLYVPRGFAHGFCSMHDNSIFSYKVDNVYNKSSEVCIRYDDPDLGIIWPYNEESLIHSSKDLEGISLKEFEQKYLNV